MRITRSVGVIDSQGRRATSRDERAEVVWVMRLGAGQHGKPFEALYDVYAKPVYVLGLQVLDDEKLAEDLVSRTFARLRSAADHYDPTQSSVRALVYGLARRSAADLARRHARVPPWSLAEPGQHTDVGNAAFRELIAHLERREALDAVVLPARLRGRTFAAVERAGVVATSARRSRWAWLRR